MSDEKMTIGDYFAITALMFGVIVVVFMVVFGLFKLFQYDSMKDRVNPICEYLQAERQGNLCVKDGRIVYDDEKRK